MAEEDKKKTTSEKRVTDDQRFNYIGFDVFPGKAKDLFKSAAEKDKLVEGVRAKRDSGQTKREDCMLFEERVSGLDRTVMVVACLTMIFSLILPWFSVYNRLEVTTAVAEPVTEAVIDDSLFMAGDSLGLPVDGAEADEMLAAATEAEPDTLAAAGTSGEEAASAHSGGGTSEEVIHGYVARKKYEETFDRLGGFGTLAALGSVGSPVFSSGIVLIVSGILFLLMILATLGLPLYSLYGMFGLKGDADQKALALKKVLKLNWIPLMLFTGTMFLAFFGANYGFDAESMYTSLGRSYSVGVFLDSLSWGAFVSIGASVLLAVKGIEI